MILSGIMINLCQSPPMANICPCLHLKILYPVAWVLVGLLRVPHWYVFIRNVFIMGNWHGIEYLFIYLNHFGFLYLDSVQLDNGLFAFFY